MESEKLANNSGWSFSISDIHVAYVIHFCSQSNQQWMKFQCENLTKTLVDFKCSPFTIRILINWTKYDSCTILQDGAYRLGRKFGTLNEVDSDLLNTFDKSGSRPRCVNKENFVVLFWNESIQLWLHGSGSVRAMHISTVN